MNHTNDLMYREVLVSVIEKALCDIGTPLYHKVVEVLKNEYNCEISDCYEHPEYLSQILEKFFGDVQNVIIDSINREFENITKNTTLDRFLITINK